MKLIFLLRYFLFPFSLLYDIVTTIRNCLFLNSVGRFKEKTYGIPLISIGNITVGGTGKTPHTEWIIRLLKSTKNVGVLSRGYKRKTKGVVVADSSSTANDLGDEPMQMHSKFPDIQVVVAEKRVEGMSALLSLQTKPDVVLLDDAYQHRYVKPGLSILIVDYNRPLWKDYLMPVGELRESSAGRKRADIIIVSKCPKSLSKLDQELYEKKLLVANKQSIYFTTVSYQSLKAVFDIAKGDFLRADNVLLVTGIAKHEHILQHLQKSYENVSSIAFSDHHNFTEDDLQSIEKSFVKLGDSTIIVTTEKDAVRFKQLLRSNSILAKYMYCLPIEIEILNNKHAELEEKILSYVR